MRKRKSSLRLFSIFNWLPLITFILCFCGEQENPNAKNQAGQTSYEWSSTQLEEEVTDKTSDCTSSQTKTTYVMTEESNAKMRQGEDTKETSTVTSTDITNVQEPNVIDDTTDVTLEQNIVTAIECTEDVQQTEEIAENPMPPTIQTDYPYTVPLPQSTTEVVQNTENGVIIQGECIPLVRLPATQKNVDAYDVVQDTELFVRENETILFGHDFHSFFILKYVQVGEIITLINDGQQVNYKVTSNKIGTLNDSNNDIILLDTNEPVIDRSYDEPTLILITCAQGINKVNRRVVVAKIE